MTGKTEIWKSIKRYGYGFNNIKFLITDIEVSNLGNVRGNKFWHTDLNKCEIKIIDDYRTLVTPGSINTGRGKIYRLVYEAFNGKIPKGMNIHHKNGNKLDDRLDNLECLTISQHRIKHLNMGEDITHWTSSAKNTHWWNDGNIELRSKESPGENFKLGRLSIPWNKKI